MTTQHTILFLSQWIRERLLLYGVLLPSDKEGEGLAGGSADGGANVAGAIEKVAGYKIHCISHVLNLIVQVK